MSVAKDFYHKLTYELWHVENHSDQILWEYEMHKNWAAFIRLQLESLHQVILNKYEIDLDDY